MRLQAYFSSLAVNGIGIGGGVFALVAVVVIEGVVPASLFYSEVNGSYFNAAGVGVDGYCSVVAVGRGDVEFFC